MESLELWRRGRWNFQDILKNMEDTASGSKTMRPRGWELRRCYWGPWRSQQPQTWVISYSHIGHLLYQVSSKSEMVTSIFSFFGWFDMDWPIFYPKILKYFQLRRSTTYNLPKIKINKNFAILKIEMLYWKKTGSGFFLQPDNLESGSGLKITIWYSPNGHGTISISSRINRDKD